MRVRISLFMHLSASLLNNTHQIQCSAKTLIPVDYQPRRLSATYLKKNLCESEKAIATKFQGTLETSAK